MNKPIEDQFKGGTLGIPDGHFVYKVDLDVKEPYCIICSDSHGTSKKLFIPKSLAYYLTTHSNGSQKFRDLIERNVISAFQRRLKSLLGLEKQ